MKTTEDTRLDRGHWTGQIHRGDLQDSEVFETTEVHLADNCQVVSIQITGTQREQRTGHESLVSAEKIMTIIMYSVWKRREKFKHTNSIYTKICQM